MRSLFGLRSRVARLLTAPVREPRRAPRTRLMAEALEAREVPAVAIVLDYSRDTSGFFSNSEARATLDGVAAELGNSLNQSLAAIDPAAYPGNSWSAYFMDPATGNTAGVGNLVVGANTIRVYVGARTLAGPDLALAGPGTGTTPFPSQSAAWVNLVATRGASGFAPWGGSIAFDSSENWHFGPTTVGLDANEVDFYSVATHELGHVLGIGTSSQWTSKVSGSTFIGTNAVAVYGAAVPLAPGGGHWADGIAIGGQPVSLDPSVSYGTRVGWSPLDAAGLRDLGWGAVPPPAPVPASAAITDAVTVGGTTYFRNAQGNVFRQEANGSQTLIATQVSQIGSSSSQLFALRRDGVLFRYDSGTFNIAGTQITDIGSGSGQFFVRRTDGALFRYDAGTFNLVATQISQIAPGSGQFFARRADGALLGYTIDTSTFSVVATQITAIGSGSGQVFVRRADGALFRYDAGTFSAVASQVAAIGSGSGAFFVLRADGVALRYNTNSGGFDAVLSGATQLVPGQGFVFVRRNDGAMLRYNLGTGGFDVVVASGVSEIGGGQNQVFYRSSGGAILRYNYSTGVFDTLIASGVADVWFDQGQFYYRNTSNVVYRYEASGFVPV